MYNIAGFNYQKQGSEWIAKQDKVSIRSKDIQKLFQQTSNKETYLEEDFKPSSSETTSCN